MTLLTGCTFLSVCLVTLAILISTVSEYGLSYCASIGYVFKYTLWDAYANHYRQSAQRLKSFFWPSNVSKALLVGITSLQILTCCTVSSASSSKKSDAQFSGMAQLDVLKLAEAIRRAENSKRHPYGILGHGCDQAHVTKCRQICLNTIRKSWRRWLNDPASYSNVEQNKAYILWLSKTYAPISAANDPTHLNQNWPRLVSYFYNKEAL